MGKNGTSRIQWPPSGGLEFARSREFGELLIETGNQLAKKYPRIDFTDAVAHVDQWLDGRLVKEPDFLNLARFPTLSAFRAYVKQAVWNAGRIAARKRKRNEPLEALPVNE